MQISDKFAYFADELQLFNAEILKNISGILSDIRINIG